MVCDSPLSAARAMRGCGMQAAAWNSGNQKVAPYNSWISNWFVRAAK